MRLSYPVRVVLIIVFGAVPATFLGYFAFVIAYIFLLEFLNGDLESLVLALWGILGVVGALALWIAALRPHTNYVSVGLIFGLVASIPAAILIATTTHLTKTGTLLSAAILPSLTAVVLLIERKLKPSRMDNGDPKQHQQNSSRQPTL